MKYFSKLYEMTIEILHNNSRNFRKYFSGFYKTIIEILNNYFPNFLKVLLKIFNFFFNFANIFRDFPKYFTECSVFVMRFRKSCLKPAIHYSQTWRMGDEIIFLSNKILLVKTRWTCCCILFDFCCQFSHNRQFFFDEKILCVRRWDRYLDANPAYSVHQKTCSRNMANAFYTLFVVCRFFVVLPLFCCCSRIVYSRL